MKEWIISIVAVVLITSIVCLILPQGKMGKFIKNIFSILTMLVIIKPIIYLKDFDYNFDNLGSNNEVTIQENFLDYIYSKRIEEYKQNCLKITKDFGVENASVEIYYDIDNQAIKITLIEINLRDSVILSDKGHIHIKEGIITNISTYLNVEKNMVVINE